VKNTSISSKVPLDELYTDGFDSEQIWEEIELLNGPVIKGIDEKLASLELESPPEMLSDSENSQSGSDAAQSDDQSGEEYSDFVDEKDQGEESMVRVQLADRF
jgi:U3 small nucleolar RNA-associated protein MPP10